MTLKNSRAVVFGGAVTALILSDQASKLAVRALVPAPMTLIHAHSQSGAFTFHLHPELNARFSLPAALILAALAAVFSVFEIVYHKYERAALLRDIPDADKVKSCPKITFIGLALWLSGIICGLFFDSLFWGGSLDFLCIESEKRAADAAADYTVLSRFDFDFKDVWLILGTLLIVIRTVVFGLSQYRLPKESRKIISKRSRHLISSIREARGDVKEKSRKAALNLSDILILTALSVVMTGCFGYLFYGLTVYFIIPAAVMLSPAIDGFLTDIGDRFRAEDIYNFIREACLMIGLFPGMHLSNRSVRRREKLFIRDTSGFIVTLDGLKYHARQHLLSDVVSVVLIAVLGLFACLINLWKISPFVILYDRFGVALGFILSVILTAFAQAYGVLSAQKNWRADCFYGE